MLDSDVSSVTDKLAELQAEYHQQLPEVIAEIRQRWIKLCQDEIASSEIRADITDLYIKIHGLTGASGTFGAIAVSAISADIERLLKEKAGENSGVDPELRQTVDALFEQMVQAAKSWCPTAIPFVPHVLNERTDNQDGTLVYLVEDDVLVAESISNGLENAGYSVLHFSNPMDFTLACAKRDPDVVLMDMMFDGDSMDGVTAIETLQSELYDCPVIFISKRTDISARLAATRAGAMRYLTKPLDMGKLVQTLDGLFFQRSDDPYRILLIDDEDVMLSYFATVLQEANMLVESLHNPLECLDKLDSFKPDLILLDVYMHGCSGLELAQVIRQDDGWSQIPIVFLSTEQNIDRQLLALNLGGDDFINKAVQPEHLIKAVTARAKRSRYASAMQKNLQETLRESEYVNITLNQHAIVSITDVKGLITYVNDKFCEISEYSREELLGQNHRMLKSNIHPAVFFKDMWRTISRGEIWHGCIGNRSKSDSEYWVESTIVPFLNERGKPYQYAAVRTDVTQMRINEDRLNRSQAFANIGTWDWNIKNGTLYWSERIAPLFGYEQGVVEHSYENFLNSVHPDDRQSVIDAVNNCVSHGAKYDIEHRVVWPDGTVRYVQESGDVVRDEYGEPAHMLGVVQDITLRKTTELALKESEQRLKLAQQIGKIGNWSRDISSEQVYWSDEIYQIFGYQPREFEPDYKRFMAAVHPDDIANVKQSIRAAVEKGEKHSVDHRIILPDGQIRWVHEEAEVVKNEAGDGVALQGTVQDISDRIWSEQLQKGYNQILELITKEKPLEDILLTIVLYAEKVLPRVIGAIMLLDESGDHLHVGAAPHLPDFYTKALDGIEIGLTTGLCCEAAYKGQALIAEDLSTHPNWVDYRKLTSKAGLGACWSLPILASNGDVLGTCDMYYREIKSPDADSLELVSELIKFAAIAIEQKRSIRALVDAMKEAEEANRAKSQFLSSMSHELRTPMNAIIGFAQLLQMDEEILNEIQLDNIGEIVSAGNHLLSLINDILDLSKIEAGRIDLYMEAVLVSKVIDECLSMIKPLADKRGIEIILVSKGQKLSLKDIDEKNMEIRADRTRLKQVLFNLLSNAVKYNKENGQIIISCAESDEGYIRIGVQDTGAGISEEKQAQLFTAFSRLDAEHSEVEGTGIGLVITKSLVEMMGGSIGVESQPGEGSVFWVELPRNNESLDHKAKKQMPDDENIPETEENQCEYTLLYIEDNPANLRLVMQLLTRRPNIKLLGAEEPMLGLELATKHCPDLILLDINLPGIDGFEVLKRLRDNEATSGTPVVAVSANAMPRDIEKSMAAGFNEYVTKPIDVVRLLSVVDEMLLSIVKN
ncbi:MAG: response regulator [Gammaproteobacteria bacterium]|nr:response regulator [Gammaproteobacteria bacterium]